MALRPTDQEITGIIDVATLAQWCGISDVPPVNTNNTTPPPEADINVLFSHLGRGPNDHFRSFAMISTADLGNGHQGHQSQWSISQYVPSWKIQHLPRNGETIEQPGSMA